MAPIPAGDAAGEPVQASLSLCNFPDTEKNGDLIDLTQWKHKYRDGRPVCALTPFSGLPRFATV